MADGFDKIQKLSDPVPGVPNFRRVPGFKVYCCGQPTIAGFENALTKVCGETYPKDGPIIWLIFAKSLMYMSMESQSVLVQLTRLESMLNWERLPEILQKLMRLNSSNNVRLGRMRMVESSNMLTSIRKL